MTTRTESRRAFTTTITSLATSIAITLATVACPSLQAEQTLRSRIDRLVQPYLDHEIAMGISIGVLHNGDKHYFGYGSTKKAGGRKPDADTIFEIGSTSKVFTGLLLADAATRGHVRLDQAAGDLLPPGVSMPVRDERSITLKHLATHVSGLPRLPDNMQITDPENPYADYMTEHLYAFLNGHQLAHTPGERRQYSNVGMGLLGHLLARQQMTTYGQLLHERIALPLGLESTATSLNAEQSSRLALPHIDGGLRTSSWEAPALAGAGTIRSSARDMLRFAKANLDPPAGKLGEAIELAWKAHWMPKRAGELPMGLGWHFANDGTTRIHDGQTGGYHSIFLVNRDRQMSVVLLTNTSTTEVDRLALDIVQMLLGSDVKPRVFKKQYDVPPKVMQRYVGKYEFLPGVQLTVSVNDGALMVQLTGQPALRIYADSETNWHLRVVPAKLTFNVDEDGRCKSVELFQNGVRQKAKRVE